MFEIWIEIKEFIEKSISVDDKNWSISYCFLEGNIYKEEFFIEGYPINSWEEEGKIWYSQNFKFNKILKNKIGKLLLPKTKKNYFAVTEQQAYDYYHWLCIEGFSLNVHPISMSNKFMRMHLKGSQEEIYNKCLELNRKWIK